MILGTKLLIGLLGLGTASVGSWLGFSHRSRRSNEVEIIRAPKINIVSEIEIPEINEESMKNELAEKIRKETPKKPYDSLEKHSSKDTHIDQISNTKTISETREIKSNITSIPSNTSDNYQDSNTQIIRTTQRISSSRSL